MIKMATRNDVVTHHRSGKSNRKIARELGMSRKTVNKIVREYEAALQQGEEALEKFLQSKPKYTTFKRKKTVLIPEVCKIIDGFIEQNAKNHEMHIYKQDMDAKQMYKELRKQGLKIGYCTVCSYVKANHPTVSKREAYIRLHYEPGEVVEFDWGEVRIFEKGEKKKYYLAVFTLASSNGRFGFLFSRQDTLAFQEAHVRFFRLVKGTPKVIVYDNARTAVRSFVGEKEPTIALVNLEVYYNFTHRFCNAHSGNEKGHVEKAVEVVRKEAFYNPNFDSYEEAQRHLDKVCAELNSQDGSVATLNKRENVIEDIRCLSPLLKEDFKCFEMVKLLVDKYSTITYKYNHYSVPDDLVGKNLDVKIYSEQIEVRFPDGNKYRHTIVPGQYRFVLDINHFLKTLSRKPGAVKDSEVLHTSPEVIKNLFNDHFADKPKEFIELMSFIRDHNIGCEEIAKSLDRLAECDIKPTLDQIKLALTNQNNDAPEDTNDNEVSQQEQLINEASDLTLKGITDLMSNIGSKKGIA